MSVTYGGIKMAWAINGTPNTLGSSGDDITISDLTSTIFNQNLVMTIATGGNIGVTPRLGSGSVDSGSNYADRYSRNGAADTTDVSQTGIQGFKGVVIDDFSVWNVINISSEEKLMIMHQVASGATGAGTAPDRAEIVGKWVNTSNQYDYVNVNNSDTGSYNTDSNLSALGTD
jgi:hypothetical protein